LSNNGLPRPEAFGTHVLLDHYRVRVRASCHYFSLMIASYTDDLISPVPVFNGPCRAVGWIWGYIEKNFACTFYAWAIGVMISVVVSTLRPINALSVAQIVFPLTIMFPCNASAVRSRLAVVQQTPCCLVGRPYAQVKGQTNVERYWPGKQAKRVKREGG